MPFMLVSANAEGQLSRETIRSSSGAADAQSARVMMNLFATGVSFLSDMQPSILSCLPLGESVISVKKNTGTLAESGKPAIQVQGLTKSIRNGAHTLDILRGISFDVTAGEIVAIVGSSGSGKSTLLGLLAGLDTPTAGNVTLHGTAISYLREDQLAAVRGKLIGFVFQSYQLIPTLTAEENVLLPYELNMPAGEAGAGQQRARDLLHAVGLQNRMDHYPVQLSGGEQQRVALARAFMLRPPIVLADEPTGNLDTHNGEQVMRLLLQLNQQEGTTLVLVTHDAAIAAHAHRVVTLRDGRVLSDELQSQRQV